MMLAALKDSLSAALGQRSAGAAATAAAAIAALVGRGQASAAVKALRAVLRLGLLNFIRDVAIDLVKQGHLEEAGRLCTAAVQQGAAAAVQQLSWLLLSAPPSQLPEALAAAAEVTAAFWTAAAAEGWLPGEVASVMAPPVLQAIDTGYATRVATVQRELFAKGLQPLLLWLQRAAVEERGRPGAAAAACWELMRQGAGEVVTEVSALAIVEGHYAAAAAVARELYSLEQERRQQFVAGDEGEAVPSGKDAAQVLAATNVQVAEAWKVDGAVEVMWLLWQEGQLDCLVDTQVAMAARLERADVAGRIAWGAILRGRGQVVTDVSAQLLLRGHTEAAAAITAALFAAAGAPGAHPAEVLQPRGGKGLHLMAGSFPALPQMAGEGGSGPGGSREGAGTGAGALGGSTGSAGSGSSGAAQSSGGSSSGAVKPTAAAPLQGCPIAAAATARRGAVARGGKGLGLAAGRQSGTKPSSPPAAAHPAGPETSSSGSSAFVGSPQQADRGKMPPAAAEAPVASVAAQANILAVDGGAVQSVAAAVVALWQRGELALLRAVVTAMAAPPLSRPDAAAAVSWAAVERGQGAAVAEVSAAVMGAGRVAEAARVMEDMADVAGASPHLIKVAGAALMMSVHAGHAEHVVALAQALLDDGYSALLNNVVTDLVTTGHSAELGEVASTALATGQAGVVAALSAVLASPKEGECSSPGVLAAIAGSTLVQGVERLGGRLGEALKRVVEE